MFHFQIFEDFADIFLWLVSSLIPLWLENILCMISILSNLFNLKDKSVLVKLRRISSLLFFLGGGILYKC